MRPIPFTLSPIDRPIPYRLRVSCLLGSLRGFVVPLESGITDRSLGRE